MTTTSFTIESIQDLNFSFHIPHCNLGSNQNCEIDNQKGQISHFQKHLSKSPESDYFFYLFSFRNIKLGEQILYLTQEVCPIFRKAST